MSRLASLVVDNYPVTGAATITVDATAGTFTRSAGSFVTNTFAEGDQIILTAGFASNSGVYTIATVTATVITVTDNTGLVDEAGSGDEQIQLYAFKEFVLDGTADISVAGTFVGNVNLQRSWDGGTTWVDVGSTITTAGESSFTANTPLSYRIGCKAPADYTSGTITINVGD